ncbi:hypothetical protein POM88_020960 [Heracleum sosnowskyi]|uniref:DUF4283 domain-containing protein n=1 Tax=Heracleum sosnowskyi TaxID=360622 RepID=A0AAD8ICS1_9APIA|nr:hypothetical protein POM88_020960 [Heracleum sosnowskyi]
MASSDNIQAINTIELEEEEEAGLALQDFGEPAREVIYNVKLCLVGRFITNGILISPQCYKLWGHYGNLGRVFTSRTRRWRQICSCFSFIMKFEIKRVIDGSLWDFNMKSLILSRTKDGENPRCIALNTMELWVQIHDLRVDTKLVTTLLS